LIREFLVYLEMEKGFSPYTILAYSYDLQHWLNDLRSQGVPFEMEAIHPPHLRAFVANMSARGLKPATICRRFNAIRSFWNYLVDSEYTERNPCRRVSTPKKEQCLPVYLSPEEVRLLLAAAEHNHYAELAFRDRAILATFVYTGIRRGELLSLNLDDVNLQERLLIVRKGKGMKERAIPIVDPLAEALSDYLEVRPRARHDRLFSTRDKRPLGRTGLTALFRKALKNSGIERKGVTIHKLRHTFATMLLQAGCDLITIQKLLGHNSLETTSMYLHADLRSLRGAVEKLPKFGL